MNEPATKSLPLPLLRVAVVVALSASVLVAAIATVHWPIVGDAPLLHYVAFLLDHGKAPYRQIIEMDFPGTYALEWTAIHVFGPGPLAWRAFDYLLLVLSGLAMISIARDALPEGDWLAGFFAGTLFTLLHFRDGPPNTGQRELMLITFVLLGITVFFRALRRVGARDLFLCVAGMCLGFATIIKPQGLLFFLLVAALGWRRWHSFKAVLIALAGFTVPLVCCAGYLIHHGSLLAFVGAVRGIGSYHAALGHPPLYALLLGAFPSVLLAVVIPALPLYFALRRTQFTVEAVTLAGCVALGALSYIMQGKGYPYHRYPVEAFLLLATALLAFPALQSKVWLRWSALVSVALGAFFLAPASAVIACDYDGNNQEFNRMLAGDLNTLGGHALNNKVQCIDTTAGCINTLYNLQLVQATGYLYDCYLFQPVAAPYREEYRAGYLAALVQTRAKVLVISNQECFTMHRDWSRLDRWPEFQGFVGDNYKLVVQRTPPHRVGWWRHPVEPFSYRIYIRTK